MQAKPFLAFLSAAAAAFPAYAQQGRIIVEGLSKPLDFVADPAVPTRFYIVEQGGLVRVVEDGQLRPEPFFEVNREDFRDKGWEQGLLGMAFDPHYAANKRFYLNYTARDGATHISRFTAAGPHAAAPGEELILRIKQPYENHNGGCIRFGPDGRLYIGMGDGGAAHDPQGHGQNLLSLLGKMLRLDVTTTPPEGHKYLTSGNPFELQDNAQPEIWAYGLRNPWKFSFDSKGRMWIADVGQNRTEWVHLQKEGSKGGENYGWNVYEGPELFRQRPAAQKENHPDPGNVVMPVWSYAQRYNSPNRPVGSITGGYFYEGEKVPALKDRYICADFMTGRIWSFRLNAEGKGDDVTEHTDRFTAAYRDGPDLTVSSFGRDLAGELYILDHKAGTIIEIVP